MPNPKAQLREQVHEVMRFKHCARGTHEARWQGMHRHILVHDKRHQRGMGNAEEWTPLLSPLATVAD